MAAPVKAVAPAQFEAGAPEPLFDTRVPTMSLGYNRRVYAV
jgi:hypothetical protein